jgi:soluble lytic murein transglycosylase
MRRGRGWGAWLVLGFAVACARAPKGPAGSIGATGDEPLAAGLAALRAERYDEAAAHLKETGRRYPALADYALYFRSRALARAGRAGDALALVDAVVGAEDSIWRPRAMLLGGELRRSAGDADGARAALEAARPLLPAGSNPWARAGVALAELADERGDVATALDLAREVRRSGPRGEARRRARQLCDAHPDVAPPDPVDEAELRLREGDAAGARESAEAALRTRLEPELRARALWTRARAERAAGERDAAEATCLTLARTLGGEPLAPRALLAAAGWRWNADDDTGALGLFRELARRFPSSLQAAEALYAIGRIDQEAGRYAHAAASYAELAERFPDTALGDEARWRIGWIRYLAGDLTEAEERFRRLGGGEARASRAAAAYWRARTLERLGRQDDAQEALARLVDDYPTSYYAELADARLGHEAAPAAPPAPTPPSFPAELTGPHAERARLLATLGFPRFARLEVDALRAGGAPPRTLLVAYDAVGAPGSALRIARGLPPGDELGRYLYPLAFWQAVAPAARDEGVDPLLALAVMRQESLFDPDAASPADAHGLMQLLPNTAREITGDASPPTRKALRRVDTNVRLGVTLLARLVARHGSVTKALAAYNGGEDALAKWERRYAERDLDEFVELISYRETRDYVKAVLGNYRAYRRLYAPSPSTTSRGSPPNAPFDMMTMTSPARAEETR